MAGVNKAIVIGHLGGDPEVRNTQAGQAIASFSIATSESWRDKTSGERKERTQWHRVVIFNEALAKIAGQYLKKGSKAYVEGQMETRDWTDQAGVKRYVTEIVVRNFNGSLTLLDRSSGGVPANDGSTEDASRPGSAPRGTLPARNSGSISSGLGGDMDDDIPL
jgi:single-strand DNA-binding protein